MGTTLAGCWVRTKLSHRGARVVFGLGYVLSKITDFLWEFSLQASVCALSCSNNLYMCRYGNCACYKICLCVVYVCFYVIHEVCVFFLFIVI